MFYKLNISIFQLITSILLGLLESNLHYNQEKTLSRLSLKKLLDDISSFF